jgi:hypothetical protein
MVMPVINDALFDESLRCLLAHLHPEWGDRHPLDVFNRLLAKNIRPGAGTRNTHLSIERDQVSSRREQWTTEELGKVARGHKSTAGQDFGCPIIIAEYEGVQRVLDGNHRINRWVAAGDTRVHNVNIHTIAGVGEFIEFPALTNGAEQHIQCGSPKGIRFWVRAARARGRPVDVGVKPANVYVGLALSKNMFKQRNEFTNR